MVQQLQDADVTRKVHHRMMCQLHHQDHHHHPMMNQVHRQHLNQDRNEKQNLKKLLNHQSETVLLLWNQNQKQNHQNSQHVNHSEGLQK